MLGTGRKFEAEAEIDPMLLTLDVGNTLINFGLWDDERLCFIYKANTKPLRSLDEYRSVLELFLSSISFEKKGIERAIISSVVPLVGEYFSSIIHDLFGFKPKMVGPRLKTGLRINTDNPSEVGSDLVSDAVGGLKKYGKGLFIADLGTANKFLFVDREGAFSGCAIAPGLMSGARSLRREAAALPEVNLLAPHKVIGKNTHECMNSGLIYGTVYEIEGFAKDFEKEAGYPLTKILTGGNATFVKDFLPDFIYDEHLLLSGLYAIDERNRK